MSSEKNKVVLKKIKDSTHILHPDSKLVLLSSKDRTAIGTYVDNEILPLDDESIELCDKWNFKYDKTFFKDEEDDGDESEEAENSTETEETNAEAETVSKEIDVEPISKVEVAESENTVEVDTGTKENTEEDDNIEPLLKKFGDDLTNLHLNLLQNISSCEKSYLSRIKDLESKLEAKDNELAEINMQHEKLRVKFKKMMSEFIENV
jgi:hypothetical protein